VLFATILAAGCGGQAAPEASEPAPQREVDAKQANEAVGAALRSDTRIFKRRGFGITFTYPAYLWDSPELDFGGTAGAADTARAGIGINKANVILVNRYDLRRAVTQENLAGVKWEVDGVIKSLAGRPVPGKRVEYGGLPGYAYLVPLTEPSDGVSRVFVLFDRKVEYFFNCQSTPETRDQLDGACDQALKTLQRA
jgi:hypothetical protein